MTQSDDQSPTVIEVQTERVEGVIDLVDVLRRVQENAVSRAAGGQTGKEVDPDLQQRLNRVSTLAAELAQELSALPRPEAFGHEPG